MAEQKKPFKRYSNGHDEGRDPPTCPYCGRVMSNREKTEQGACNECQESRAG